ncbi:hypothetical protein JOC78_001118 [Bacillus ectoiniformans]|uniref:hypothetical protein n=1 Tax=Bacillus ectoiniformans TaxID=1494429 RepID=UPI00195A3B34|nr:hypothetical protein [Bacillus ectoiniformans]MBM7648176.1 hypothetical protein [Bacillus ectoiniformans]
MRNSVSIIFQSKPEQWGLRGDPYLWDELEQEFTDISLPCSKMCFIGHFKNHFHKLTNHPFDTDTDSFTMEEYDHGGMSSGQISVRFWRERGLPLLLKRLEKISGE